MIAVGGIVFITLGVPFATYVLLTRNRHKLYSHEKFSARFGLLYAQYEPEFYWYELAEMLRKVALLGISMFIAPGTMKQVMCCLLMALVFMTMHIKLQPFDCDTDDNLQVRACCSAVPACG